MRASNDHFRSRDGSQNKYNYQDDHDDQDLNFEASPNL